MSKGNLIIAKRDGKVLGGSMILSTNKQEIERVNLLRGIPLHYLLVHKEELKKKFEKSKMKPDKPKTKTDEELIEFRAFRLVNLKKNPLYDKGIPVYKKRDVEILNSKKNAQHKAECKDCMESMERKAKAVCNIVLGEELAKRLARKDREIEELKKELRTAVDHIQNYEREVEHLKQQRQGFLKTPIVCSAVDCFENAEFEKVIEPEDWYGKKRLSIPVCETHRQIFSQKEFEAKK